MVKKSLILIVVVFVILGIRVATRIRFHYEESNEIISEAQSQFGLGNAYFAEKEYEKAIAAYERAIALIPSYGAAMENLEIAKARLTHGEFIPITNSVGVNIQNEIMRWVAEENIKSGRWAELGEKLKAAMKTRYFSEKLVDVSVIELEPDRISISYSYLESGSLQSNTVAVKRSQRR